MRVKPMVINSWSGVLTLDTLQLPYLVQRKTIRHVYFRMKNDHLQVSVPRRMTVAQVERLLSDHHATILRLYQRAQQRPQLTLSDGQRWSILGKSYTLSSGSHLLIEEDRLIYPASWALAKVERQLALRFLWPLLVETTQLFWSQIDRHRQPPVMRLRTMKRLYGVYYSHNHTITYNTYLVHLEPNIIRYVVLHELTHAVHLNHSPDFYAAIARIMPDYRRYHDQLKQSGIAHFDSERG